MFDQSANYTFDQLFALIDARTAITLYFSTLITGDKKYAGSALITSLKKTFPSEENVTFEMSFEGTGALTETIL
jgi:predicted secreted protein